MDEGLVGGESFAVDASLIQADANKQRSVPGKEWNIADIPADATQFITNTGDADLIFLAICTPRFEQQRYEHLE